MARFSVLLDACALVPIAQADTLLRLAEARLFRPLWSATILDEVTTAVTAIHPELSDGRAARRAERMNDAFPDALVTGWEPLVDSIELPDRNDRHVVAAAIRGRADLIVTANLRDFPGEALARHDLEATHPDAFLVDQLDLDPDRVVRALLDQAAAARRPPLDARDLLTRLGRCGLTEFARAAGEQLWRGTGGRTSAH